MVHKKPSCAELVGQFEESDAQGRSWREITRLMVALNTIYSLRESIRLLRQETQGIDELTHSRVAPLFYFAVGTLKEAVDAYWCLEGLGWFSGIESEYKDSIDSEFLPQADRRSLNIAICKQGDFYKNNLRWIRDKGAHHCNREQMQIQLKYIAENSVGEAKFVRVTKCGDDSITNFPFAEAVRFGASFQIDSPESLKHGAADKYLALEYVLDKFVDTVRSYLMVYLLDNECEWVDVHK